MFKYVTLDVYLLLGFDVHKSAFLKLLILPILLMLAILKVSYIYWQMEENTIQTSNNIPNIEKLIVSLQQEGGDNDTEKMLSYTQRIHGLMLERFDHEVERMQAYRDLLSLVFMMCIAWVIVVLFAYKEINKNLTKSSSVTRKTGAPLS